jgi:hypothetical protein
MPWLMPSILALISARRQTRRQNLLHYPMLDKGGFVMRKAFFLFIAVPVITLESLSRDFRGV